MKLKERLKASYAKTEMERVAELMSITSLGDRSPEHLLNYMQGLLPGELKCPMFRYVWLTALPDSIHQVQGVRRLPGEQGGKTCQVSLREVRRPGATFRAPPRRPGWSATRVRGKELHLYDGRPLVKMAGGDTCLLYTSDAADE